MKFSGLKTLAPLVGLLVATCFPVSAAELPARNAALALQIGNVVTHSGRTVGQATKQVYRIRAEGSGMIKSGSAFLVSGKRVVATNHHVIEHTKSFTLGYVDARAGIRHVELQVLAVYPQKDLALLEALDDLPGEPLPLAVDYPELGSDLVAIGFPEAADVRFGGVAGEKDANFFQPSVVRGAVSRVMTGAWLTNQIQHQAPITLGYSGGPLIDNAGVVVGVSSAVHKEATGIAYGVAASDLASLLGACSLPIHEVLLSPEATSRAAPAAAPATAIVNQPSATDRALLQRADEMLKQGDVVRAQYLLEHLAREKGLAAAAARLSEITIGNSPAATSEADIEPLGDSGRGPSHRTTQAPGCSRSLCSLFSSRSDGAPILTCQKP